MLVSDKGKTAYKVRLEGDLKLFLVFSPAKPRNIFIFEQKKPMKLKKRSNGKLTRLLCTLPGNYHAKRLIVEVYSSEGAS